jgi:outer membrane lipoprotein-sorting protein
VKKSLAAVLILSLPAYSFAHTLTDVVANMENSERQVSALRFDYEQTIRFTAMESVSTVHGKAYFAKGGKFRIMKQVPEEQIIVSDGKTLSVYTPSFKQMWKGPWRGWQKAAMVPKGFVPLNDFTADLKKNFNLSLVPGNSKEGRVGVNAVPKDASSGYRLELGVSDKTWLVEEVRFISDTADVRTLFSRIEQDPAVADNLFSIAVPKGVEVIPLN